MLWRCFSLMSKIQLYQGDCLELMKKIPDKSIDMVLCDLPYGTTACKWDSIIPFDELWEQYKRIGKDNAVFALFGSEPFSSQMRMSNIEMFRYDWIWEKDIATGYLSANKLPMRKHEIISIFYLDKSEVTGRSDRFKELRDWFYKERKLSGLTAKQISELLGNQMGSHYFTKGIQFTIPTKNNYKKLQTTGRFQRDYSEVKTEFDRIAKECKITYNPQFSRGKPYVSKRGSVGEVYSVQLQNMKTVNYGLRYPKSLIKFNTEKGLHSTQKPVDLLEYLIKTYTNDSETALDNCMGSGSTGVACVNTNRNFIGIELDEYYFQIAKKTYRKGRC